MNRLLKNSSYYLFVLTKLVSVAHVGHFDNNAGAWNCDFVWHFGNDVDM